METKKNKNKISDKDSVLVEDPAIVRIKKKETNIAQLDSESDEEMDDSVKVSKKNLKEKMDEEDDKENIKPKLIYKFEETELAKMEIEKNIYLRVVDDGNRKYVDIRRFYKGYPTKKGIRFNLATFKAIKKVIEKV